MKDGAYPVQEAARGVNVRYVKVQVALFAQNLAVLSDAVSCTPEENDCEFEKSIIFEDDDKKKKGDCHGRAFPAWRRGSAPKYINTTWRTPNASSIGGLGAKGGCALVHDRKHGRPCGSGYRRHGVG
jgi:hypothetical protein